MVIPNSKLNMKTTIKYLLFTVIVFTFTLNVFSQVSDDCKNQLKNQVSAVFEENKGQMKDQNWNPRPDVLYSGNSEGMNFYIRNSGMSYQLTRIDSWKDEDRKLDIADSAPKDKLQVPNQFSTYRVDAEWINANQNFNIIQGESLQGYNNYYNVPEGIEPALFVKKYESLTLKNLWEGVDIHYYGTEGFLETDYLVAPGADYRKIKIQFKGAELSTDEKENLIIKTPFGEIHEGELKVFQNNQRIEAKWKIDGNVVSFDIPHFNPDLALRIDPLTRVWGTYYGGLGSDYGSASFSDASGNAYLGGSTVSTLSISSGGYQNTFGGGNYDAFLVKFDSNGIRQWGSFYGGGGDDSGYSIAVNEIGIVYLAGKTSSTTGIALGGHQNAYGGGISDAFLVKFNSFGLRLWGTYYGGALTDIVYSTSLDMIGNIHIAGTTGSSNGISFGGHQNTFGGNSDAFLVKFNTNGTRQWGTYYGSGGPLPGDGDDRGYSCSTDGNGNVYLVGYTKSNSSIASGGHQNSFGGGYYDAFLVKFNLSGLRQWGTYYGGSAADFGFSSATDAYGNVFLAGQTNSANSIESNGHQNFIGGNTNAFLVKFNINGVRQWGTYYGGVSDTQGFSCVTDLIGNVYMAGQTSSGNSIAYGGFQNNHGLGASNDAFIVKFNTNCVRLWGTYYGGMGYEGDNNYVAFNRSLSVDYNGNLYLAGCTSSSNAISFLGHQNIFVGGYYDAFLVKFKQSRINGMIWNDINQNCMREATEIGTINGINLTIQPGNYIIQSNDGAWSLDSLPAGIYVTTIDTTNLNWTSTCPITQTFTVNNSNSLTDGPNFGMISTNPCTDPDVTIFAPFLRRCFPNQKLYISACNQTTATGALLTSYVDVELDSLMTVTTASLSYTSIGNNIFQFQTGDLNPGQCVNFNITTTISCNAMLGQTLCMDANLYPVESCVLDSASSNPPSVVGGAGTLDGLPQPCTLPWDQSSLSADGWCQNDTIYFTINNNGVAVGGDMECYAPVWITVDGIVTFTDSIMISGGQTVTYSFPGNGQTWILNAEQHPLHPGNSHPKAHVEACGDITNWTPDEVNDFPVDDADPVVDIYCGVVTGSYDPNDKTGFPIGQSDQFYIQPNQQLQYAIRFQNTGTDTAFTVVIRDTLDTDLNIFTVTPGVSSHLYEFRKYGPRVLEWTFNNINLPDSSTNQTGSNGFVTFHVEQVPNLSTGTEIINDADIYFDFNDPITTNTTIHRIFDGFVSVLSIDELTNEEKSIIVYPNPTSNIITIKGYEGMNQTYFIYDYMGRVVFKGKLNGISTEINMSALSKGIYTIKINANYKHVQIVKE